VILAEANAYLGLFAGMTVSASIPVAVVSMGLLRLLRKSNILVIFDKPYSMIIGIVFFAIVALWLWRGAVHKVDSE